jgi:FkbM family methyltransferase
MINHLRSAYRVARVHARKLKGTEPHVPTTLKLPLEFHGNDYCGWAIPKDFLSKASLIVDVGVGEDISFTQSAITRYGCSAVGFDPTPRAVKYIDALQPENFVLHKLGLAGESGKATFNLPTNSQFVSGSIVDAEHLAGEKLEVGLVDLGGLMNIIQAQTIDILKIDIEGAEYDLIQSQSFAERAGQVRALCVEFHHRWPEFGAEKTIDAVRTLQQLGFACAWGSKTTNEEFLFVRR